MGIWSACQSLGNILGRYILVPIWSLFRSDIFKFKLGPLHRDKHDFRKFLVRRKILSTSILNTVNKNLTPTWFEHATFWSGVRRATVAPRSHVGQGLTRHLWIHFSKAKNFVRFFPFFKLFSLEIIAFSKARKNKSIRNLDFFPKTCEF